MQRRELLRPRLGTIPRDQIIAAYVAMTVGVTLVATVVLASIETGPEQALSEWPLWLSLTLLAALLERVRTDLFGDGKVSLSFVPLFAIALIIGPVPTILTGASVGLVRPICGPAPGRCGWCSIPRSWGRARGRFADLPLADGGAARGTRRGAERRDGRRRDHALHPQHGDGSGRRLT